MALWATGRLVSWTTGARLGTMTTPKARRMMGKTRHRSSGSLCWEGVPPVEAHSGGDMERAKARRGTVSVLCVSGTVCWYCNVYASYWLFFFNGSTLVNLERQQYTYSERVLPLRLAISLAVLRVSLLTRPYSNYDSDRFFACCTYDRHTCFFSIDCLLATRSACSV